MKNKTSGYPIMFSKQMVRALRSGEKNQTRRIVKSIAPDDAVGGHYGGNLMGKFAWVNLKYEPVGDGIICPFGKPGDLLYVREDFRVSSFYDRMSPAQFPQDDMLRIHYEADGAHTGNMGKKRENMFMPRWMSRITLELTSIIIERLQDINNHNCIAEGINKETLISARKFVASESLPLRGGSAERYCYALLWEEIHGSGSWAINPFVWVLNFTIIHDNIDNVLEERASHAPGSIEF